MAVLLLFPPVVAECCRYLRFLSTGAAQNLRSPDGNSSINCAAAFSFSRNAAVFHAGTFSAWTDLQPTDSTSVLSREKAQLTNQPQEEYSMKVKNLLTICGVAAALMLSAGSICAQNNGGGGGGNGGGGGGGGFGGGRGNFDPAQMQQRMMDRYRQDLNFTNDADWSAVQPLVQKVLEARMAVGFGGRGFGRGGRGGGQGGPGGGGGGFGQQPNPDRDALQQAIDDNAPAAQVKALLAKYEASQKAKQAALIAAQADLRKVLTVQQEASATLAGLLD